jgi:predicted Zn-dependent peptidase
MPHIHSVSISFFIGAGSRYETEAQAGVSHFIEHLCFRGTAKRPTSREISTEIEGIGGILNGGTDKEITIYWCKVAQPHFQTALDVMVDMLLNSKFDPQDMEKERQIIIEEINMSYDSPTHRVALLIEELLWAGHPLGRDIAGSKESVAAITRDMLFSYLARQYQPSNTVVAVAGDIQHQQVVTTISQILGKWTSQQPNPGYLVYQEKPAPRVKIETRDTEQVQLCLALPGLSLLHPKRFSLDLLNAILGEGMSSRLFTEIRDKMGLAYSISSYADHFLDTGSLVISAGVDTKNLSLAIEAILKELSRLTKIIPESELNKAREFSKGRLLLRMEDSRNVAGWLGGQEILMRRILTLDEVVSIIDAITAEELQQLAQELLVGDRLRLAVVGPVPPDEPLEKLLRF